MGSGKGEGEVASWLSGGWTPLPLHGQRQSLYAFDFRAVFTVHTLMHLTT